MAKPRALTKREKLKRQFRRSHALRRQTDHCVVCFGDEPLHVHHLRYRKGGRGSPLEQPEDLVVLCVACHRSLHANNLDGPKGFLEFKDRRRMQLFNEKTVPAWIRL